MIMAYCALDFLGMWVMDSRCNETFYQKRKRPRSFRWSVLV